MSDAEQNSDLWKISMKIFRDSRRYNLCKVWLLCKSCSKLFLKVRQLSSSYLIHFLFKLHLVLILRKTAPLCYLTYASQLYDLDNICLLQISTEEETLATKRACLFLEETFHPLPQGLNFCHRLDNIQVREKNSNVPNFAWNISAPAPQKM